MLINLLQQSLFKNNSFKHLFMNDLLFVPKSMQDDLMQDDLMQNDLIKNDFIKNDFIEEDDLAKNDSIKNDLIQDDLVQNDLIQDDLIEENDLAKNNFTKNQSVTKKYCIYFPYRLDVNELKLIEDYDQLHKVIKRYLIDDDELDDRLSLIKNFIRYNQEQELILLRFQNRINAILFSREGYKPFNILPVINDLEHDQSFIAISQEWHDLFPKGCIVENNFISDEIIDMIQNIYDEHRQELIPMIERVVERLLKNHFN